MSTNATSVTAAAMIPAIGDSPMTTPPAVAIPVPPLNLKKMGYQCPTTQAAPAIATIGAGMPNTFAAATAAIPFRTSATRTTTPKGRLTVRKTFAAPGFPVPSSRMFVPRERATR